LLEKAKKQGDHVTGYDQLQPVQGGWHYVLISHENRAYSILKRQNKNMRE